MAENRKLRKSPTKDFEQIDQPIEFQNVKLPHENSTADQAFFLQDAATPHRKYYDAHSSEDDSAYGQDKDFESISNENDQIPEFDPRQQLLGVEDQMNYEAIAAAAADEETPHGQSMEENISPDDAQTRSPLANQAEYPLATQPFKPFIRSSGNLHSGGVGPAPQMNYDRRQTGQQNQQQQLNAKIDVQPLQPQTNMALQAPQRPIGSTANQQAAYTKAVGKVAASAMKNGNSNKLDKSQQIRNSYHKFMAGQHAQGTNSQRPMANQPAFFAASGTATAAAIGVNPLAEPVVATAAVNSRPNRRAAKAKNGAARSKTVKPQAETIIGMKGSHQQGVIGGQGQTSTPQVMAGSMTANTKNVDLLVIGAGPAALGFLVSAVKNQRFGEILQDDGVAILDNGISLGGGMLCNYGINSNTSANSFLKCIFRRVKEKNHNANQIQTTQLALNQANAGANPLGKETVGSGTAKNIRRRQKSVAKERVNQHQSNKQQQISLEGVGVKPRERQMSPIIHQKWVLTRQGTASQQPQKQAQDGPATPDKTSRHLQSQQMFEVKPKSQKLAEPLADDDAKEQPPSTSMGQPQDPDMDEAPPICQQSSGNQERYEDVFSQDEADLPDPADAEVFAEDAENKIQQDSAQIMLAQEEVVVQENLADVALVAGNDRQPKKTMKRKKSRDDQSLAGRNSKKQQQISLNRNQALKQSGAKPNMKTGLSAAQTSLAIYAQSNLQTTGPNAKSLITQMKARLGEAGSEPKVWTSDDVLTPFKDIFPSNISQMFRKLAKSIVPLSLVGHLLNYVGNHLLHYAYKSTGKRIYMPKHKAMSIHLMGNGEIVTQALKTEFTIIPDPSKTPPTFQVIEGKQSIVYFRSKAVVIAGGASQGLDQRITEDWFPKLDPEQLIASDSFLKKHEYLNQIQRLRALQRPPKVVIIGGSHSGFSCAWLLLNGPAMYTSCFKNQTTVPAEEGKEVQPAINKIPYAYRKSIKDCMSCCTCGNSVLIASQKLAAQNAGGNTQNQRYMEELRSQSKAGSRVPRGLSVAARELSPINKNGRHLSKTVKQRKDLVNLKQNMHQQDQKGGLHSVLSPESKPAKVIEQQPAAAEANEAYTCSCVCKCLGYFKYDEWPNLDSTVNPLELPEFGEADIKILYRDRIKVFFKSAKEAYDAGYTDFDIKERQHKKKDGYVYSFTGLRGDAKSLFLDVTSGKEKRVNFVKAETPELQRPHVEEADLVIWACGYQTNAIKIHDVNKKELALSQKIPGTQYDIDGKNRIILADGNVLNKVFACGVGFPVRTKDGGAGNSDPSKNPRADSFSLYMHTVGEVLLKSLLPKKKIAGIISHKEVANPYLKAATYEQILKDKQHKNKKPLLQQVSTKKEKSSTKLGQLATATNTRVQKSSNVPLDIVDSQAFMNQEMTNVYTSYLQTAKPGSKINVKIKPTGLNSDLEDLSGFGLISAHASKTNCFSYRAEFDQIQEASDTPFMQRTCYEDVLIQQKSREEVADMEDERINPVLKFPEIKRETPFVKALPENNSKYNSLNHQSLTSFSNMDLNKPHSSHTEQNMTGNQEEYADDINDRDNSLSVNILPSHLPLQQTAIVEPKQLENTLLQQQPCESNKSIERVITSTSRNNQVLTPSITGKSPLLLQKKQQMIIQKTKEPLSSHVILQQTAVQHSQNIATMTGLKPTVGGKNQATGKSSKGTGKNMMNQHASQKAERKVMHTQDLFKKHNQILAAVDQSPYMHFGVQSHPNTEKQRNSNASKTSKGGLGKRNFAAEKGATAQSSATKESTRDGGLAMFKGVTVNQSTVVGGKSTTVGRNPPQSKDQISTLIQQNQKAFSEREQHLHTRYKAVNVASGISTQKQHPNGLKEANMRKEHLASVDISKSSHNAAQQIMLQHLTEGASTGLMANNQKAENSSSEMISDLRETFGHNKSQNMNQGMYSVKSLVSNSEFFPPITNKGQDMSLSSTVNGGKHKRLVSSSTNNGNQITQNDSVRSLHLSSQQANSTSMKQKNPSISAQKAAAVLSQQKGLVYAPTVQGSSTVGARARGRQQQNAASAEVGYMISAGRSSNATATAAQGKSAANTAGGTSQQQAQHTSGQGLHSGGGHSQKVSQHQNRSSFNVKKKNLPNNQSLPTALTHNGLLVPVSDSLTACPDGQDLTNSQNLDKEKEELIQNEIFLSQEKNTKKVIESSLTSPKAEQPLHPDLCEMGVNDISLRMPNNSADRRRQDDRENQIQSRQAYEDDQFQPESDRTTVVEISQEDPMAQQDAQGKPEISQPLGMKHSASEKEQETPVPKIISNGGNNHFKAAKKMSQNTTSGGAYGELVAQLQTNVAAKTPNLRQPSKLQQPKEGDLDQVEHVKSSQYTSQTIERKDSGPEAGKQSVNKKVESALGQKQSQAKLVANKSPTPHKATLATTGKHLTQPTASANLQRSARRHTGAVSATDLQALEKTPRGTGLKGRQSIGASSVKRPLNSIGLFDKFVSEKEANKAHHYQQALQPYLEVPPSNGAANDKSQQNQQSNTLQATSNKKTSDLQQPGRRNQTNNARLSMRQKQVLESQNANFKKLVQISGGAGKDSKKQQRTDVSPAKPDGGITDKTQLLNNPAAARLLASANDIQKEQQQPEVAKQKAVSTFSVASKGSSKQIHVGAQQLHAEKPSHDLDEDAVQLSIAFQHSSNTTGGAQPLFKKQQQSTTMTPGYSKAAASGFFVHKTIRDLAICSDLTEQEKYAAQMITAKAQEDNPNVESQDSMQTQQIKAIKKEVHSKVANLSPVLKKRGQSKVNLGAGQSSKTQQNNATPSGQQLNTSKYRSPIRTTLKSAVSSTAKDGQGANQRHISTQSKDYQYGLTAAASAQQAKEYSGSGLPARQSQTLRQNQQAAHHQIQSFAAADSHQQFISTGMRSPKSGGRRHPLNGQDAVQNKSTGGASSSGQQHQQQHGLISSSHQTRNRAAESQSTATINQTASGQVQIKKEIMGGAGTTAARNQKK